MQLKVRAKVKFRAFFVDFGKIDTGFVPVPLPPPIQEALALTFGGNVMKTFEHEFYNQHGIQLFYAVE